MDRLRLRSDLMEWRQVDDEIVALDLKGSVSISVTPPGAAIWPLLAEGAGREELTATILERFDVDEPTASRDLDAFLDELFDRGVLERMDAPGTAAEQS